MKKEDERKVKSGETRAEYKKRMEKLREKEKKPLTNNQRNQYQKNAFRRNMNLARPGSEDYWHYRSAYEHEIYAGHSNHFFNARKKAEEAAKAGDKKKEEHYIKRMAEHKRKMDRALEKAHKSEEENRNARKK